MSTRAGDGWERVQRAPTPRLARLLTRVCGYREWAGAPVQRSELPPPTITVILGFKDPIAVGDDTGSSRPHLRFAAGLATRATQTEHDGVQEGLQLDLTPAGARAFLGVAPAELVGHTVDLDQMSGPLTAALVEEVAEVGTWEDRLIMVERRLVAAIPDLVAPPAPIEAAWGLLRARSGKVSVNDLASHVGWSPRHLSVQFRKEVGLPPSVVAGVFRARHAVSMLAGPDGLATVAAQAGYSDQSHMTRELRRYTGRTPDVLRRTHHLIGTLT